MSDAGDLGSDVNDTNSLYNRSESSEKQGKAIVKHQEREQSNLCQQDEAKHAKPSLRELTRQAYSKSSLHSFKAKPYKHEAEKRHPSTFRPKDAQTTGRSSVQKSTAGLRRNPSSRGQPNMKLRMQAMLERIKRDYS